MVSAKCVMSLPGSTMTRVTLVRVAKDLYSCCTKCTISLHSRVTNNTSVSHVRSPVSTYSSVNVGTLICINPEPWTQTVAFIRSNTEDRYSVIIF